MKCSNDKCGALLRKTDSRGDSDSTTFFFECDRCGTGRVNIVKREKEKIRPKFNKNELFCKKCLVHDHFFRSGCLNCGSMECITYEHLSSRNQVKAGVLFDKMWKEQWNIK